VILSPFGCSLTKNINDEIAHGRCNVASIYVHIYVYICLLAQDALSNMEVALKMKNVDEEDQAQAAMLADALISKVLRTYEGRLSEEDTMQSAAMFKDPSLWRAHSVLAEVSQLGVWSHSQQQTVQTSALNNNEGQPQSPSNNYQTMPPVMTDMKFENYMREVSKRSDPMGAWR
jgi:hypothetical protein